MKIIAKAYPAKDQIKGRIDSGAFDGIEVYIPEKVLVSFLDYRDLIGFARDNFQVVNLEAANEVVLNGRIEPTDYVSADLILRDKSRRTFEDTLKLADGKGKVTVHLVGKYSTLDEQTTQRGDELVSLGKYFAQFGNVLVENVMPAGLTTDDRPLTCQVGCDPRGFISIYNKFKVPMTLDIAHLGMTLEEFSRQSLKGHIYEHRPEIKITLTQEQMDLGQRVLKEGLTKVLLQELKTIPSILNVHFANTGILPTGWLYDGFGEFSQPERLVDLGRVLSYLKTRTELETIVPEIVDGLYPNKDYVKVPHMVECARELRKRLQE